MNCDCQRVVQLARSDLRSLDFLQLLFKFLLSIRIMCIRIVCIRIVCNGYKLAYIMHYLREVTIQGWFYSVGGYYSSMATL